MERDFDVCIAEVEKFLPYVDNWATSDQLLPKVFKKSPERLLPHIDKWIASHDWCVTTIPDFDGEVNYYVDKQGNAHIVGIGNVNFFTIQTSL